MAGWSSATPLSFRHAILCPPSASRRRECLAIGRPRIAMRAPAPMLHRAAPLHGRARRIEHQTEARVGCRSLPRLREVGLIARAVTHLAAVMRDERSINLASWSTRSIPASAVAPFFAAMRVRFNIAKAMAKAAQKLDVVPVRSACAARGRRPFRRDTARSAFDRRAARFV
jgi:hypothetical protein